MPSSFSRLAAFLSLDGPTLHRRLLFLVGGVAVGLLAVVMAKLADWAQAAFALLDGRWSWAPLLVTPAGFALAAWLTRRRIAEHGAAAGDFPAAAPRRLSPPPADGDSHLPKGVRQMHNRLGRTRGETWHAQG